MKKGEEKCFRCPLCGNVFEKDLRVCPKSCPLGRTCGTVSCPRCHYRFVEESKTINFFKGILKGKRSIADGNC